MTKNPPFALSLSNSTPPPHPPRPPQQHACKMDHTARRSPRRPWTASALVVIIAATGVGFVEAYPLPAVGSAELPYDTMYIDFGT